MDARLVGVFKMGDVDLGLSRNLTESSHVECSLWISCGYHFEEVPGSYMFT